MNPSYMYLCRVGYFGNKLFICLQVCRKGVETWFCREATHASVQCSRTDFHQRSVPKTLYKMYSRYVRMFDIASRRFSFQITLH